MRAAILRSVFLSGVSLCLAATAASAQKVTERKYDAKAVESFYKGKQVDFFIGSEASGGYNAYARIVGQHLARHVPGNPTFVPQNMPGAGSLSGLIAA